MQHDEEKIIDLVSYHSVEYCFFLVKVMSLNFYKIHTCYAYKEELQ